MRTVLIGAVESSRVALEAMVAAGTPPGLVMTLPSERASQHSDYVDLSTSAAAAGVEVAYIENVNDAETLGKLRVCAPDVVFVIGWSQLCKAAFRSIPRLGVVGYHPAALPHMRGRAVLPWTILLRERVTASTLLWIDDGVDTGPICAQAFFHVAPLETARSLYDKHMAALRDMLPVVIGQLMGGEIVRMVQDEACASYCAKRTPDDGRIDWAAKAEDLARLVRATTAPYPGAFTLWRGERLIVWAAEATDDYCQHYALPGQIVEIENGAIVVRCGDQRSLRVVAHSRGTDEVARFVKHGRLG
jgi:methionyl-tRNA formyltransferase